jgi:hypothetical protein
MAYELRKVPFTAALLPSVQSFECGEYPWELEVSNWIRGIADADGYSVRTVLAQNSASVWLYINNQGLITGFGSVGAGKWRYPGTKSKDPFMPLSVIPMVGVRTQFQGQPKVQGIKRYAVQIMDHLRAEAETFKAERPRLGLMVHPLNRHAVDFYEFYGFKLYPSQYRGYLKMSLDL